MTNFIFDRPHERTTKIDDRKCSNIVPKLQMKKTPLKLYIYHRWSSLSQNRSVVGEGGSYTQTIKSRCVYVCVCVCVWGGVSDTWEKLFVRVKHFFPFVEKSTNSCSEL